MKYGIFDTVDNCWLGDDRGPRLFAEGDRLPNGQTVPSGMQLSLARISAQITSIQMGYSSGRLEARSYDDSGDTLKDEVPTLMTPAEALKRAMGGAL